MKAFVLMPYSDPYDSYYLAVFKPALEAAGYEVSRADDDNMARPIMLSVEKGVSEADLLLCDMSALNPNVFYELGLAHAIGKPVILVSVVDQEVPFNLHHVSVIFYNNTLADWQPRIRQEIGDTARSIARSPERWPQPLVSPASSEPPVRGRELLSPMQFWPPAQNANDLLIIGINLNLVLRFRDFFADKLQAGASVRLVIADPDDPHLVEIIGRGVVETSHLKPDFEASLETIIKLREGLPKDKKSLLDLRVMDYVPSLSYQVLDGETNHGSILVELAPNRISVPERPHFILNADKPVHQEWYGRFFVNCKKIYDDARPWQW